MPQPQVSKSFVGIITENEGRLTIRSLNKRDKSPVQPLNLSKLNGAKAGDIVLAERPLTSGTSQTAVKQILGQENTPGILTTISLYEQGLSDVFSQAALNETKGLTVPPLGDREDLRKVPLVTVDGKDSRDFDDAIFAEHTKDGGMHLIVAIADVSWYVRPGSALDKEAYKRGNSTYFPDRAVPMLPEAISNGLSSLKPHEDRAVMVYHLWIDKDGNLIDKKINRGLMNSAARLTYEQLQAAHDGKPDATTKPLMDNVVTPLYEAYDKLKSAADRRKTLNLGGASYKAEIDAKGETVQIAKEDDATSHDVIAQFMINANTAADQARMELNADSVHRVHTGPEGDKLASLQAALAEHGFDYPAESLSDPEVLNAIIMQATKEMPDHGEAVSKAIGMSLSKAFYDATRDGHWGLALKYYGHDTSPIRRYADLENHRSLVKAFGLGEGGLTAEETARLQETAEHISDTEKRSVRAERSADDRYAADFISKKVGKEFNGRVSGVIGGGVFVRLDGMGVEGMLPVRTFGDDHYTFDKNAKTLTGDHNGKTIKFGDEITVRVKDASGLTGKITLEPAANDNNPAAAPDQNAKNRRDQKKQRNKTRGHAPR